MKEIKEENYLFEKFIVAIGLVGVKWILGRDVMGLNCYASKSLHKAELDFLVTPRN